MFHFKQFDINDEACAMKIGTDGVLLGAWADAHVVAEQSPLRCADIGAGSGLIAMMIAQRYPKAEITAVEIDPDACRCAQANIAAVPDFASRISVENSDFADYAAACPAASLHLIVSNPPFFSGGLVAPNASRARARHQSQLSYAALIGFAAKALTPEGSLAFVTPADCRDDITMTAELARLKIRRLCTVTTREGRPPARILWQFSRTDGPIVSETLTLRHTDNTYTNEYRRLTADFYLHF